jgi:hypothetical protein
VINFDEMVDFVAKFYPDYQQTTADIDKKSSEVESTSFKTQTQIFTLKQLDPM